MEIKNANGKKAKEKAHSKSSGGGVGMLLMIVY